MVTKLALLLPAPALGLAVVHFWVADWLGRCAQRGAACEVTAVVRAAMAIDRTVVVLAPWVFVLGVVLVPVLTITLIWLSRGGSSAEAPSIPGQVRILAIWFVGALVLLAAAYWTAFGQPNPDLSIGSLIFWVGTVVYSVVLFQTYALQNAFRFRVARAWSGTRVMGLALVLHLIGGPVGSLVPAWVLIRGWRLSRNGRG